MWLQFFVVLHRFRFLSVRTEECFTRRSHRCEGRPQWAERLHHISSISDTGQRFYHTGEWRWRNGGAPWFSYGLLQASDTSSSTVRTHTHTRTQLMALTSEVQLWFLQSWLGQQDSWNRYRRAQKRLKLRCQRQSSNFSVLLQLLNQILLLVATERQ